ncbi:hypothetical protein BO71DRAFT_399804 [Aspergillus ellipticus CBS 707.79]|uniref:Mid2 domain-containing protein n=1 Tax=Aspergillus ellipticus CBS 707.79 TaxID=1448320 RepID=A0A319DYN0_9EURO|nr:hypothetical protein BO71DRAFT_399804 [Aspergillus ellipticus CBS 707.79]
MIFCIYALVLLPLFPLIQGFSAEYTPLRTYQDADRGTTLAVKRALLAARGTTYSTNSTALTKSWNDATLFSIGASSSNTSGDGTLDLDTGLAVICKTCYINGSVSGFLTVNDDFNMTQAVESIKDEVVNVTEAVVDQLESFAIQAADAIIQSIDHFEMVNIPAWPTLDVDFDLDEITRFPDVQARFKFDNLELYLELDIELSAGATYTLDLFTSETIVGFSVPGLDAGAVFKVSLVLIAEAEIDISSGIHIQLDDGLALELELFNKNVSGITLPGGRVEFLPITIEGQGSLQALLQIEASVGFDISSTESISVLENAKFSAGIGAQVFTYVADALLQVNGSTSPDASCALEAVAEYTLAVGAAAGATVAVDTYQWGPSPNTTVPIFYTTIASLCAGTKTASSSSTITSAATLEKRDNSLVPTTVSTSTRYTVVGCASSGLINCPVNLQNTTSVSTEMTTVLTVASGVDATYPANTFTSLTSAIPFGKDVRTLSATSGTPVSYTPPSRTSSPTGTGSGGSGGKSSDKGHHSNQDGLIIGLSVGLGVPAVIALAAAFWWFVYKRPQYSLVPQPETPGFSPRLDNSPKIPQVTEVGA